MASLIRDSETMGDEKSDLDQCYIWPPKLSLSKRWFADRGFGVWSSEQFDQCKIVLTTEKRDRETRAYGRLDEYISAGGFFFFWGGRGAGTALAIASRVVLALSGFPGSASGIPRPKIQARAKVRSQQPT